MDSQVQSPPHVYINKSESNSTTTLEGLLCLTHRTLLLCLHSLSLVCLELWHFILLQNLHNPPAHIAFCLNDPVINYDRVSDLIFWCKQVPSIRSVTFYQTFQPDLNSNTQEFDAFLAKFSSSTLSVSFLSFTSGRESIVRAAQKHSKSNSPEAVTAEQISDSLRNDYPSPDPELLIVLGSSSLLGYPLWQLRLTEILFHSSRWPLTLSEFLHALKTFSKCEQRFGK